MASGSKGNCYICGVELKKTPMKTHILKSHNDEDGEQECYLLKVEGAYAKDYWLYFDIPVAKSLTDVDKFLRQIWLECCGHLSEFCNNSHNPIAKNRKLNTFSDGDKILHQYDFGTTTETIITFIGHTHRKTQKALVRLLARNTPPSFRCEKCGNPADLICLECIYDSDNPFYCYDCGQEHEHSEMFLPLTNSPRMGECGYEGELDIFTFVPPKTNC